MFVRVSKIKRKEKVYEYAQLVVSERRPSDGRPVQRTLCNLGPADSVRARNVIEALKAAKEGRRVMVVRSPSSSRAAPRPVANLQFLDVVVMHALWDEWGLGRVLAELMGQTDRAVHAADIIAALVLQRCVNPDSKLAATRWFPRTALPEWLGIPPEHFNNTRLHRALDELHRVEPSLQAKLPHLYQERTGTFVRLFLDVTDAWFEGQGPSMAQRTKTKEGLVQRKVGIVLLCNERGYPLRWSVIPGRKGDATAMTELLREVAELSWVKGKPVVVDRAMGHTAQLRELLRLGVRFLTALGANENAAYAHAMTLAAPAFEVADDEGRLKEAAEWARESGMEKATGDLFVLDLGCVTRNMSSAAPAVTLDDGDEDDSEPPGARALRCARAVEAAVADQCFSSYVAAGAAHGLTSAQVKKYRGLLRKLSPDVQAALLDGEGVHCSLAELLRIASLKPDEQLVAFHAISQRASGGPIRRAASPNQDEDAVGVRVIACFSPRLLLEKRKAADAELQAVRAFAQDFNRKLAMRTYQRDRIVALVDKRLRRDGLINVFRVDIEELQVDGRTRYRLDLVVDQREWDRRRRYDGFYFMVTHPDVNDDPSALVKAYRQKDVVEKDFQVIKSVTELRPIRHRNDEHVRAHVTLCMLALLLERTLRDKLKGTSATAALTVLQECRLNRYRPHDDKHLYTLTQLDDEAAAILRALCLQHLGADDFVGSRITPR